MDNAAVEIFTVLEGESGVRLDKLLADRFRGFKTRSYFQNLIEKGLVLINRQPEKKRVRPKEGDRIEIQFTRTPEIHLTPEDIPLDIIYEDDSIIVINKPAGMVVHPAPGNWSGTLVNALLFHCRDAFDIKPSTIEDPLPRPGIVHRLDKETSGVIVAAKNSLAHERLVQLFSNRVVKKEYIAICLGNPGNKTLTVKIGRHPVKRKEMTTVEEGGKEAVTYCETEAHHEKLSLVRLKPVTGRTHQIRVHMKFNRTPILGDRTYGNEGVNRLHGVKRQMLHANVLEFPHPITHEPLRFVAEIPEDMQKYIQQIKR